MPLTYYQRGGCDGSQAKPRRELPAHATDKQRADYEAGYVEGSKYGVHKHTISEVTESEANGNAALLKPRG